MRSLWTPSTRTMILMLAIVALLLLCSSPAQDTTDQQAFMVWDAVCLSDPKIGLKTKLEAPMVNGEPDMRKALLYALPVTYNKACGHVEIRRVKR